MYNFLKFVVVIVYLRENIVKTKTGILCIYMRIPMDNRFTSKYIVYYFRIYPMHFTRKVESLS